MVRSADASNTESRRRAWPGIARGDAFWQWWVMLLLGAATLALGWFGFSRYYEIHGQAHTFWHKLYVSLQLFTIESGPVPGPVPLQLNIARFLAPVVPAWALVRTLFLIFSDRVLSLRMRRLHGHIVVCGLGRRGAKLAFDFLQCGSHVVAIERDPENPDIRSCRDLGGFVVVGDATDERVLARARVERAEHVIAVTGDDGANAGIAVLAGRLVRDRGPGIEGTVHCSMQVSDRRLASLLQQHHVLSGNGDAFEAEVFDTYRASARILLREHPLDYERIDRDDTRRIHLVVVGFGQMGESVALQAATIGCFANEKKLKVTVIDRVAGVRERDFTGEHPQVRQVLDLEFVEGDAEDPVILRQVGEWAEDRMRLTTVAVCLDDDSRSLSCALSILSHLGDTNTPLLVRMSGEDGLTVLLEDDSVGSSLASVFAFGAVSETCTREALLHEDLDALARAIHEDYVDKRLSEGRSASDPSMRPWSMLEEGLRDSSRASADHIPVKLRAIGCHAAGEGDETRRVYEFEPDEIQLMGRMEHARWRAERLLAGWLPGRTRSHEKKLTPYLIDWDDLADDIKKYDFDVVSGIPRFLRSLNLSVYRD